MQKITDFQSFWWWLYNNIFVGKVAASISVIFLIFAIYIFVRRKMFGLSLIFLSVAFIVAYAGGFILILRGV